MSLPPPPERTSFQDRQNFEEAMGFWQARGSGHGNRSVCQRQADPAALRAASVQARAIGSETRDGASTSAGSIYRCARSEGS